MNLKQITLAVFVTALFVFAIGATWALAQSSGQVSACVDDKGKVVVLGFAENISCDPEKEEKITWSIIGPQGPQGDTGPQGPPGPAGESWFDAQLVLRGSSSVICGGCSSTISFSCQSGEIMLNAGYTVGANVNVSAFYPDSTYLGTTYVISIQNHAPIDHNVHLRAWCAQPSSTTVTEATESGESNLIITNVEDLEFPAP